MHVAFPTLYDIEFIATHRDGGLALLATKHVDDIKVTGSPQEKAMPLQRFEDAFGKGDLDVRD
eukprot:2927727-Pyramimonas_sp.AAC.1